MTHTQMAVLSRLIAFTATLFLAFWVWTGTVNAAANWIDTGTQDAYILGEAYIGNSTPTVTRALTVSTSTAAVQALFITDHSIGSIIDVWTETDGTKALTRYRRNPDSDFWSIGAEYPISEESIFNIGQTSAVGSTTAQVSITVGTTTIRNTLKIDGLASCLLGVDENGEVYCVHTLSTASTSVSTSVDNLNNTFLLFFALMALVLGFNVTLTIWNTIRH